MTAEAAMLLPLLAVVALALAWAVSLASTQARVVDAAREVARASARDEPRSAALALGREVAPAGARFSVSEAGGRVVVEVVAEVRAPVGLLRFLPPLHVDARAVAAQEAAS
ncbi:MAG: TadE family type IV pilus minor pilin [Nocardioidaceae bacterium]